jgi:hypothetical protein
MLSRFWKRHKDLCLPCPSAHIGDPHPIASRSPFNAGAYVVSEQIFKEVMLIIQPAPPGLISTEWGSRWLNEVTWQMRCNHVLALVSSLIVRIVLCL